MKTKEMKGITLVALVVTIVVLLILAAVSINLVLGNNGIIKRVQDAKTKTAEASENDLKGMNVLIDEIDSVLMEDNKLTEKTLVEAYDAGELKEGDYVNYMPIAGKTYTSVTNENGWADQTYSVDTSTTWRVLGKEGDHILLIAGSPIKKNMNEGASNYWEQDPYLWMKGAYSYVNCVSILNNICAIYSNNYGIARSITIEDINKVCGVKVEGNTVYLESDANKTDINKVDLFGNTWTYNSSNYYTPESYIDGKKKAMKGEEFKITDYSYDISSMKSKVIGNTTLGSLLFDRTSTNDSNRTKPYWLATSGIWKRRDLGVCTFRSRRCERLCKC